MLPKSQGGKSVHGALSVSARYQRRLIGSYTLSERRSRNTLPGKISRDADFQPSKILALGSADHHRPSPYLLKKPHHALKSSLDAVAVEELVQSPLQLTKPQTPLLVTFDVPEFVCHANQHLVILGSGPTLGNWDPHRAIHLSPSKESGHSFRWTAEVRLEEGWQGALEFKLATIEGSGMSYEPGSNRLLVIDESVYPSPKREGALDQDADSDERRVHVGLQWGSCSPAAASTSAGCDITHLYPYPSINSTKNSCLALPEGSSECTLLLPLPLPLPHTVISSPLSRLLLEGGEGGEGGGMRMMLVGGHPSLGDWVVSKGLPLTPLTPLQRTKGGGEVAGQGVGLPFIPGDNTRVFQATATLPLHQLVEAKVVLVRSKSILAGDVGARGEKKEEEWEVVEWEPGPNRFILLCPPPGSLLRSPFQPSPSSLVNPLYKTNQDLLVNSTPLPATASMSGAPGLPGPPFASKAVRTSGGRGYTQSLTRGSDPALAQLLGTNLSSSWDDSDSEEDSSSSSLPSGSGSGSGSPSFSSGTTMSNILPFSPNNNLPFSPNNILPFSPNNEAQRSLQPPATSVNPSISPSRRPSVSSSTLQSRGGDGVALGGDYVIVMHWGSSSSSSSFTQPIFRPLLPPLPLPAASPSPSSPSPSPSLLHVTLPSLKVDPGSRVILVGSHPNLGAWDPNLGVDMKWGPGDRWTGSVDLGDLSLLSTPQPLAPPQGQQQGEGEGEGEVLEMKLVVVKEGDALVWEPGMNKRVDLFHLLPPLKVKRQGGEGEGLKGGSGSGSGEVHLTLHWGLPQPSLALVVPTSPPNQQDQISAAGRASNQASLYSSSAANGPIASHANEGDLSPGGADELARAIGLLTTTLFSLRSSSATKPSSSSSAWSMEGEDEMVAYQSKVIKDLQSQLKAVEAKVEEKEMTMTELSQSLVEKSESLQALQSKLAAHLTETQALIEDRVQIERARMLQEVSSSRQEFESKILDIQRNYESRILDLQQHESKIVAMQQQHDSIIEGLNAQHDRAVGELQRKEREAEARARDFESRLLLECRRRERDLSQSSAEIDRLLLAHRREIDARVSQMATDHALEVHGLVARIEQEGQKIINQAEEFELREASTMRSIQERHDHIVEDLIARQAQSFSEWESQRQELLRRCQSLNASKQEVEGRALGLAKSLGLRTVDLDLANAKALRAETARSLSEREKDRLAAQVARLEGELAAARRSLKPITPSTPPHPHPSPAPAPQPALANRFVESMAEMSNGLNRALVAGTSSLSGNAQTVEPSEAMVPCKCPVWALRPLYQPLHQSQRSAPRSP